MKEYKLVIQPDRYMKNANVIELNLHVKEDTSIIENYYAHVQDDRYVRNDYSYSISAVFDGINQNIEVCYINNEKIDNCKNYNRWFIECFGILKIEVVINEIVYVTDNIAVWINENNDNTRIVKMIDYIYENCDDYLYEEHKHSKISSGIIADSHISLDSKLALLEEIYKAYTTCYSFFLHSPYSKLVNDEKVGSFNELQTIGQKTITHISRHPEELQAVKYNSGITVNKQYYQPNRTLVQTTSYTYDIYENRVIVGFIAAIVSELHNIMQELESLKRQYSTTKRNDGYVESSFFIYTKNLKIINEYIDLIRPRISEFEKLFYMYKSILPVKELVVTHQPRYTNVFRNLMPYRIVFNNITSWFKCGKYNIEKSDLLLSFISLSKIYEYFCLIKINRAIEANNYVKTNGYAYKYIENRYYSNTTYHNTFEFQKDDKKITVYFQPVIYGKSLKRGDNELHLFRNTSISIHEPNARALFDDAEPVKGNYYSPDFIIKVNLEKVNYYYIIDAKHMTVNNVKKYQLPFLVYKYLFSISPVSKGNIILGLCIFCGKDDINEYNSIHDIAHSININLLQETYIVKLSGINTDNSENINNFIKKLTDL